MAKVSFSKLGCKVDNSTVDIMFNGQTITVKQYLPIEEKMGFIANVVRVSSDANRFANPIKVDAFIRLEIMYAYTNISFTDKQKEEPGKLHDMILSSGLYAAVRSAIPEGEYNSIYCATRDCIDKMYQSMNSAYGIMESIAEDFSQTNLNASEIQQKLADPKNMEFLKGVLTKLG